jgi:MFS family permease
MKRSFWSLVAVQIQVLLNDNAAKLMLIALGISVAGELFPNNHHDADTTAKMIKTTLAAIIILPFIVLAPAAGWVADRFSKRNVIVLTLWAQTAVMALLTLALMWHSMTLCTFGLFLLGIQCAFFSPAKQGIIKEIVQHDQDQLGRRDRRSHGHLQHARRRPRGRRALRLILLPSARPLARCGTDHGRAHRPRGRLA